MACKRCAEMENLLATAARFYENRAALMEFREAAAAQLERDLGEMRVSFDQMASTLKARLQVLRAEKGQ